MATQLFQPQHGSIQWLKDCIERGKHEEFDERVTLNPGLAAFLLELNTNNRHLKEVKMAQFLRDLTAGRWRYNGAAIQVRKDGVLGDGQHRCLAVVKTGISIPTRIGFGLDQAAIDTLDIGGARTPGDVAKMRGIDDPMLSSAIARLLIGYFQNGGRSLGKTTSITGPEIQDRLVSDPLIAESAHFARGPGHKIPVTGSITGFCHYLLSSVNRVEAEAYLTQIALGTGLEEGDPALTVREFLIRRSGRGTKATGREKRIEVILRGWVAYREDRKFRQVAITGTFPELD